jgi:Tfp pilus assembly protein PilO
MAKLRKLVALTAVAVIAIVAAGYFLVVSPKNAAAADLRAQADKETTSQGRLKAQIAMLTQDEKHAAQYQAQLAALKLHMPDGTDQPSFIREVYKAADAASVDLTDVTPGLPVAPSFAAAVAPKPAATDAASGAGSSASAATSAPPAPAAVNPLLSLSVIPVAMTVSGTYDEVKDFLDRVSRFRRAYLVSGVNLSIAPAVATAPAPGAPAAGAAVGPSYSGRLTAVISGSVFSAGAPGVVGTVLPPTPSPSPTATKTTAPASGRKK